MSFTANKRISLGQPCKASDVNILTANLDYVLANYTLPIHETFIKASQSIPTGTPTKISFDSGGGGLWNIGDPTRITIPVGFTKCQITVSLSRQTFGTWEFETKKNNATYQGEIFHKAAYGFVQSISVPGAIVECTGGDYFEVVVTHISGVNINYAALVSLQVWA
jgi:hypothetical protein